MSFCLSIFLSLLTGHAVIVYGPCVPVNSVTRCVVQEPVVWIEPEISGRVG